MIKSGLPIIDFIYPIIVNLHFIPLSCRGAKEVRDLADPGHFMLIRRFASHIRVVAQLVLQTIHSDALKLPNDVLLCLVQWEGKNCICSARLKTFARSILAMLLCRLAKKLRIDIDINWEAIIVVGFRAPFTNIQLALFATQRAQRVLPIIFVGHDRANDKDEVEMEVDPRNFFSSFFFIGVVLGRRQARKMLAATTTTNTVTKVMIYIKNIQVTQRPDDDLIPYVVRLKRFFAGEEKRKQIFLGVRHVRS